MQAVKAPSVQQFEEAVRRAAGYDLLARCFAYPDDAAVGAMRESAAATGHLLAEGPLDPLLRALATESPETMEVGYARCYTLTTSPDCPTFETAYVCTDPAQQPGHMATINGFYRAFGADASSGFRPDDICVELEFMSFLCRKQAYALEHMGAPRVAQSIRAQRMFLTEHLGVWAGALARKTVSRAAAGSFHQCLGVALRAWLEEEQRALRTGPIKTVDRPQLVWPDRSERGGAAGVLATVAGSAEPAPTEVAQ